MRQRQDQRGRQLQPRQRQRGHAAGQASQAGETKTPTWGRARKRPRRNTRAKNRATQKKPKRPNVAATARRPTEGRARKETGKGRVSRAAERTEMTLKPMITGRNKGDNASQAKKEEDRDPPRGKTRGATMAPVDANSPGAVHPTERASETEKATKAEGLTHPISEPRRSRSPQHFDEKRRKREPRIRCGASKGPWTK